MANPKVDYRGIIGDYRGTIGDIEASELQEVNWKIEVCWKINDFLSQPGEDLDCYDSPEFGSPYGKFFMRIFPNWMNDDPESEWVRLDFFRDDLGAPRILNVRLGIKGPYGWTWMERDVEKTFGNGDVWHSVDFCLRSQLRVQESRLMPDNVLTIKCVIKNVGPVSYFNIQRPSTSSFQDASIQTDSEVPELVVPATESHTLTDQAAFEGNESDDDEEKEVPSSQIKKTKKVSLPVRHSSVIRSLKVILAEGRRADVCLKLGCREWLVHRTILEGRSGYFSTRLEEADCTASEVQLEDFTEDSLDSVLQYLYTGEVGDLSVQNVCGLYVTARKFRLEDLKSMCVDYMKENMCVEMVCDALAVAKMHDEGDLKGFAAECFFQDIGRVFSTEGWKRLRQNHPSVIDELLRETIRRGRENRGE